MLGTLTTCISSEWHTCILSRSVIGNIFVFLSVPTSNVLTYRMVTNFDYLAEKLPVLDLTNLKVSN